MDTPDREAAGIAFFLQRSNSAPLGGKDETQVVLSMGDRAGTEIKTGWASTMQGALDKAEAYIKAHLPGRTLG